MDEHALQCQVVTALRAGAARGTAGLPLVAAVPNQLIRQSKIGTKARAKREGLVSGFPDLLVIYRGRLMCVELKSPSRPGKAMTGLSDNQRQIIADLALHDVETIVSKSFDDVIAAVKSWIASVDAATA
jgi:hypothetical protein